VSEGDVALLRKAWEAFARGDVAAAAEVLDPKVQWCGAGEDEHEGGCHSRDEAFAFMQRALADGVTVGAFDVRDAGDRVVVLIQTHQPQEWGEQPQPPSVALKPAARRIRMSRRDVRSGLQGLAEARLLRSQGREGDPHHRPAAGQGARPQDR